MGRGQQRGLVRSQSHSYTRAPGWKQQGRSGHEALRVVTGALAGLKSGFRCLAQAGQCRLQPQCLLGSRVTCRQTPALCPVPRDI